MPTALIYHSTLMCWPHICLFLLIWYPCHYIINGSFRFLRESGPPEWRHWPQRYIELPRCQNKVHSVWMTAQYRLETKYPPKCNHFRVHQCLCEPMYSLGKYPLLHPDLDDLCNYKMPLKGRCAAWILILCRHRYGINQYVNVVIWIILLCQDVQNQSFNVYLEQKLDKTYYDPTCSP